MIKSVTFDFDKPLSREEILNIENLFNFTKIDLISSSVGIT